VFEAEQLTRKHTHHLACTFDQGAITQRVFACVHCMRRNPPAAPHFGVCEACFDVCHRVCGARRDADGAPDLSHVARENVDFFAIERKRHFRCDCGTAAAPLTPACLWKLPTKSQGVWSVPEDAIRATRARADELRTTRNDANQYSQSFQGLYCWCSKPWSFDGATEMSMRQCEVCLEWYHDETCLKSADNRYSGAAPFALICRSCVPKCAVLHPYLALASDRAPADESNDDENHRAAEEARQLQAALIASHTNGDCHRPPPLAADARTDVNLFANFAELLCACDACAAALRDAGLHFLLEEEPTESECEETVAPEDVPLVDMMTSSTRDMSFEQQHLAGAFASDFRAALSAVVANKESGAALTEADIAEFRRHMDAALAARRSRRLPSPE
jgi:hypothetical protein